MNSAQKNYTVTEKELLAIVECLKQFRNIVYGFPVKVYSDHKNLVHTATASESQRVTRWRWLLEEFGPEIIHIKGEDNTVADALSRLPKKGLKNSPEVPNQRIGEYYAQELDSSLGSFPLDYAELAKEQQKELKFKDKKLSKLLANEKSGYHKQVYEGHDLVMYKDKLYIPKSIQGRLLQWYHHFLCHPGGTRLAKTLSTICYWKGMQHQADALCKKCSTCQKFKKRQKVYGHLPPKEVGQLEPWERVHIDLVGPYSITAQQDQPVKPGKKYKPKTKEVELQLLAMTFVDPATGWFEVVEVPLIDQSSARISRLFDDVWLHRYPRPKEVIFDNGSEFKKDFVPLLKDFRIKPKPTSVKNPQANAPVERIHQVLGHMLRTKDLVNHVFDHVDPWGSILASIAWAIRSSYHQTLGATPGQLVFNRDMVVHTAHMANWKEISNRKQVQVDRDNQRENARRVKMDYTPGMKIMIIRDGLYRKLEGPHLGPFSITEVFANGTVRIQKSPYVQERLNIRRITPYFE